MRFRPLVLCYHGVSNEWEHRLAVRPRELEQQVRSLLLRRYRPATATEVVSGRGRLVHVTFDDAYRNVEEGVAVLERLGVPATVFACSGFADEGGRPLDVPRLAADVRAQPDHFATMTWDELRALAERGVEVGSHTVTHAHLPQLADAELARELRDSRARIEDELRRPCRYLAYPYGDEDERVRVAARAAGYEAAFALSADLARLDPHAIPRVDLYRGENLARATLKLSPLFRPLSRVLSSVRR